MLNWSILEQCLKSQLILVHAGRKVGNIEVSINGVRDLILQDLDMFVKLQLDLVLNKWLEYF